MPYLVRMSASVWPHCTVSVAEQALCALRSMLQSGAGSGSMQHLPSGQVGLDGVVLGTHMYWPMASCVGSTYGFSSSIRAVVTPYFTASAESVSPF